MHALSLKQYETDAIEAANFVLEKCGPADIALTLGSGLSGFTDLIQDKKIIDYKDIPHMISHTISGHKAFLVHGYVENKGKRVRVMCMAGRNHAYEGYHAFQLTFGARLMKLLGCQIYFATNASGGCINGMFVGSIMAIESCLNLHNINYLWDTLRVETEGTSVFGTTWPKNESVIDPELLQILHQSAAECNSSKSPLPNISLFQGTYCFTTGPTFETPSEVISGRDLGVGCFGMSTVPEILVARAIGMRVIGCSLITNLAAGLSASKLSHAEVKENAALSGPNFQRFIQTALVNMPIQNSPSLEAILDQQSKFILLPPHTAKIKLPLIRAGSAPEETIEGCAATLAARLRLYCDKLNTCIVYFENSIPAPVFVPKLGKHVDSFPLLSLPGFIGVSSGGQTAKLSIYVNNRACSLVLHIPHLYGLEGSEADFFCRLIARLGFKSLNHYIVGDSAKNGTTVTNSDKIVPIDSTFDLSWRHDLSFVSNTQLQYKPTQDSSTVSTLYVHFPGPTYPSASEKKLVTRFPGRVFYGIHSIGCFRVATRLGLESRLFLTRSADVSKLTTSDFVFNTSTSSLSSIDQETNAPRLVFSAGAALVKQNGPSTVARLLKLLHRWYPEQSKTPITHAIILSPSFHSLPITTKSTYPTFRPTGYPVPVTWTDKFICDKIKVCIDKNNNKCLLVFTNTIISSLIRRQDPGILIRSLILFGINSMTFLGQGTAVDPTLKGQVVRVQDHGNFTGLNPLFGQNVEDWGVRFLDMTTVYSTSKQSDALTSVKVAYVYNEKSFPSQAKYFYSKLEPGYQALTSESVSSIIVAHHMKLPTVYSFLVLNESDGSLSVKQIQTVKSCLELD